jgi:hypothetical protein
VSRLHPIRVYDLWCDALRRAKGERSVAIQAVYDAGYAHGSAPRLAPAPVRPARDVLAVSLSRPIVETIASRHQTSPEVLCSTFPRGPKADTQARDEAAWLLRHTGFRYADIAVALGLKCHTSAMDGVARMEARIAERPGLRDELLALVAVGERRLKAVG